MNEELKKCPFCGFHAELTFSGSQYGNWRGFILVKCKRCGAAAKGIFYYGEPIEYPLEETVGGKDAIRYWNTRVNET